MNDKHDIMIKRQFAINLRMIRKNQNITQDCLASAIGVDRVQIALWETARAMPRVPTVLKIAKVLKISLADLFDNC